MEQDFRIARVHNSRLSGYWNYTTEHLLPSTNYYKTYGLTSHEVENKFVDLTPVNAPNGLKVFEAEPIEDFYMAIKLTVKRKKSNCMMYINLIVACLFLLKPEAFLNQKTRFPTNIIQLRFLIGMVN